MSVNGRRSGLTLLEVLLAVGLAGALAIAATGLARASARVSTREVARGRAATITEDALAVTAALIDDAVGTVVLGDTTVLIESLVLDGVPCADGTAVALVRGPGLSPASGDRWLGLERVRTAAGGDSAVWRPVAPMPLLPEGSGCAASDAGPALLRVIRLARIESYRTSAGVWMVGFRECPDGCDPIQPLAGPIRAPVEGGWQLRSVECGVEIGVRSLGSIGVRWRFARRC